MKFFFLFFFCCRSTTPPKSIYMYDKLQLLSKWSTKRNNNIMFVLGHIVVSLAIMPSILLRSQENGFEGREGGLLFDEGTEKKVH